MKLFKVSLLSLFAFLSLLVVTPVFAVTTPPTETPVVVTPEVKIDPFVIADISIQNAKVVSQDGNKINLSFDVVNGGGAQAGLKYSISLVKDITNISKVTDEYIYPDILSLSTNTTVKKEVTYTAPAYLSGEYLLIIQIRNNSGIILGLSNPGKVKLSSTLNTINIQSDTCYLSVVGEKGSPKYTLNQGIDITSSEKLALNCTVINSSKKEITATPTYETHLSTIYGDVVTTEGGNVTPITLKAGEKKVVSLILPKSNTPQTYAVKVYLKTGETFSNSVSLSYIIKGLSISIRSFSLDKDYYSSGDTANLSISWENSLIANNYKSRIVATSDKKDYVAPSISTLTASIVDENQKQCISPINQVLDYNSNGILKIPARITRNCKNPQAQIQIKDATGNILVDKQFSFNTNTESANFLKANTFFAKYGLLIIIGILVVAGISFYFINLKKKEHASHDLSKTNESTIQ